MACSLMKQIYETDVRDVDQVPTDVHLLFGYSKACKTKDDWEIEKHHNLRVIKGVTNKLYCAAAV